MRLIYHANFWNSLFYMQKNTKVINKFFLWILKLFVATDSMQYKPEMSISQWNLQYRDTCLVPVIWGLILYSNNTRQLLWLFYESIQLHESCKEVLCRSFSCTTNILRTIMGISLFFFQLRVYLKESRNISFPSA